ncbi:MAG: cysteine desulfurase family protein [Acidimicrobiales bacterium]
MPLAYFDHAATTPLRPEAREAMLPYLADSFGNPSGAHLLARQARRAIDDARDTMAEVLGCEPGEVVFTSGGTESDNLAVLGVHDARGGVAVCSAIEHHAVLDPVEHIGGRVVGADARGVIALDALADALDESVTFVSVHLVNNEIGSVQPLDAVAAVVRERAPGAVLHTDAVQAVCWLDVADRAASADLISVSAHKFGGPKGVGVLAIRDGVELAPRVFGGGQERDRRSGTQNVAGIVAMAAAARVTAEERKAVVEEVGARRDRLADGLVAAIPGTVETAVVGGDRRHKIAGNCHVCIEGIESEALLVLLERDEVYASAASSCSSGAQDPSHVLRALGVPRVRAQGSLRLSLCHLSTDDEVDRALDALPRAVERLRLFGS